jgi:hypothetical protein
MKSLIFPNGNEPEVIKAILTNPELQSMLQEIESHDTCSRVYRYPLLLAPNREWRMPNFGQQPRGEIAGVAWVANANPASHIALIFCLHATQPCHLRLETQKGLKSPLPQGALQPAA